MASTHITTDVDFGGQPGQFFAHNYGVFKYHDDFYAAMKDETKAMDRRMASDGECAFQADEDIAKKLHKLARGRMKAWKHEDKPRIRKHIAGWDDELESLNLDKMISACYHISSFMINRDKKCGPRARRRGMESVKLLALLKKYFIIRKANYKKAIKLLSYAHNEDSDIAKKHMKDFTKIAEDLITAKDEVEDYLNIPKELCFPDTKEANGFSVTDMVHSCGEDGNMKHGLEHIYKTCSVYVSVSSIVDKGARPVNLHRRAVKRGEVEPSNPMLAVVGLNNL